MTSLADGFDALFLDLDGTLYRGKDAVDGAAEVLSRCSTSHWYVTNNASRSSADVADHLSELGFDATSETVVTSSYAGVKLLASLIDAGSAVLVVGTEALADEVRAGGFVPVRSADPTPDAVVQGHSPDTDWAIIAEATYAIRAGATWVVTNADTTLPTARGLGPGNGAMVAAVRTATGATPRVAGKPEAPIMRDALERSGSRSPLVVGDRLDTDIAGAAAVDLPSLLVLTGVSTAIDVLRASTAERPSYLAADLSALLADPSESRVAANEEWSAKLVDGDLTVECTLAAEPSTPNFWARALCAVAPLAWDLGEFAAVVGSGAVAESVVARWHR